MKPEELLKIKEMKFKELMRVKELFLNVAKELVAKELDATKNLGVKKNAISIISILTFKGALLSQYRKELIKVFNETEGNDENVEPDEIDLLDFINFELLKFDRLGFLFLQFIDRPEDLTRKQYKAGIPSGKDLLYFIKFKRLNRG